MKSLGKIFLMLGVVFWILSFTGDQSPAIGIVFMSLGIIYIYSNDGQRYCRKEKGNS